MKLAVIGSRNFNDRDFLEHALDQIHLKTPVTLLVSGGARGADRMGEDWAKKRGIPKKIFYPDWDRYGKSAGFRRNADIVNTADSIIAFQVNKSRGTQHSINLAEEQGKPVYLCEFTYE